MKKIHLSSSEELLMEIFWQKGTPLSSLELLDLSLESPETSGWGVNYIHKMLTMLQKKIWWKSADLSKRANGMSGSFVPA